MGESIGRRQLLINSSDHNESQTETVNQRFPLSEGLGDGSQASGGQFSGSGGLADVLI